MDEILTFPGFKLNIVEPYNLQIYRVFNERNILSQITEHIIKDVDRMNLAMTCKYFYNFMFNTAPRKMYSPRTKFFLNISFLRSMAISEDSPYYGKVETKNVIQFDTSGACTYVWNYNHLVYKSCRDDYGKICISSYFVELNYWLTLHSQLITDVRLDFEVGCKSLFYKEIIYIILEKLINLKRISMDSNLFYVIANYYFENLQSLTKDRKNIILEISAGKNDNGGITRRFKKLNEWLTPEHNVELIPKVFWSCNQGHFGCPLINMSVYKHFRKIKNISSYDFYMFFDDQQNLEEVYIFCDCRAWNEYYDPSYCCDSLNSVSKFTFCCNNQRHVGCGMGILSWFPLKNNGTQNFILRELSFPMNNYCDFILDPNAVDLISKIFPNITLLTLPASGISSNLDNMFCKFHHLKDILIWNISFEQLDRFTDFAANFSMSNYLIETIYLIPKKHGYYLSIENAIAIKKRFKYFEVDSKPVKISNGEYVIEQITDFTFRGKISPRENKYVNSAICMFHSKAVKEKFENIISPKFY